MSGRPQGTVLVVEDDQQSRYMMLTLLKGHGYTAVGAGDGSEALTKLREGKFSLVITDLLMPHLDGFGLCRAIRADATLAHLPVLVYTATYTAPEDEGLAKAAGADAYLVKPSAPPAIIAHVAKLMAGRPAVDDLPGDSDYARLHQARLSEKLLSKVAELQAADDERREREVLVHALSAAAPVGILYMNRAERMVYANERWWSLAGEPQQGNDWTGAFFADDRAKAKEIWDEARRKDHETRGELRIGTGSRHSAWVLLQVKPLHVGPAAAHGYLVIMTDITAEKALQERQKLEALGTMVGGFAHEFSNLLVPILGYTQYALETKELPEAAKRDLVQVLKAAEASRELTRQVLTFARQDSGEETAVDLSKVLRVATRLLRPIIPSSVTVEHHIAGDLPMIRGVEVHMQQLILNLTRNAIDAIGESEGRIDVTLAVEDRPAGVRLPDGRYVALTVADTGAGIPGDVLPRIFDPFFTTKPVGEGTGLGLSVVHGIVEKHGGSITVESHMGRGTTFRVHLPVAPEMPAAVTAEAVTAPVAGKHVLFVDDDAAQCDLAQRMFLGLSYLITVHDDPRTALDDLRDHPEKYDIVITDEAMPHMRGTELASRIGKLRPGVPVILMSSAPEKPQRGPRPKCIVEVLKKPFALDELKRAAAQALSKR